MKKILYLLDNHIDSIGGSQKSTKTIIEQMLKLNYKIGVFMTDSNISNKKEECSLYNKCDIYIVKERCDKSTRIKYTNYLINQLLKCIVDYKPDIIHAQNPRIAIVLGILLKLNRIDSKVKCIYTDRHFFEAYSLKNRLLFKFIGGLFELVITTTKTNKKAWEDNVKLKKSLCISNVLEDEWFLFSQDLKTKIKRKMHLENKFVIGFSGRFQEYKRWDTVYEICKYYIKNENVHFSFTLTADNDDDRKKMDLFIQNIKLLLGNKVSIIVDADLTQMKEFYYSLDLFVLTSERESFGRTLLEAMTKGNIVIGTNSGGVPDVIKNADLLFEVGDYKSACWKIDDFINDILMTKELQGKLIHYVKENFSVEKLVIEHNKIYNEM